MASPLRTRAAAPQPQGFIRRNPAFPLLSPTLSKPGSTSWTQSPAVPWTPTARKIPVNYPAPQTFMCSLTLAPLVLFLLHDVHSVFKVRDRLEKHIFNILMRHSCGPGAFDGTEEERGFKARKYVSKLFCTLDSNSLCSLTHTCTPGAHCRYIAGAR